MNFYDTGGFFDHQLISRRKPARKFPWTGVLQSGGRRDRVGIWPEWRLFRQARSGDHSTTCVLDKKARRVAFRSVWSAILRYLRFVQF
jgi:hypothetical protein